MEITAQNIMIPALAFISVICLGSAALSGTLAYRRIIADRLRGTRIVDMNEESAEVSPLTSMLQKIGSVFSPKSQKGKESDLQAQLSKAGLNVRGAMPLIIGFKMVLFLGGLIGLGLGAMAMKITVLHGVLFVLLGSGILFFVPNIYLKYRIFQRSAEIRSHLPDAIDLLEICVSGGMGLDMAWNSVADEIRQVCPLLADEMALTNLEMHLGLERAEAMRNLAKRTDSDEIASLVAVLVQSEKFGTSIAEALRIFTTSMREIRSQKAEETAEKMAVKMLFPMVVFIFPVVLIIAVGPAGIMLVEVLG